MRKAIHRILSLSCLAAGLLTLAASVQSAPPAAAPPDPLLVPLASDWQYFKGFAEASEPDTTVWREVGFDDTGFGWATGTAPFYYENGTGYSGNTLLSDMNGGYSCIFMRRTFNLPDPAVIESLVLDVQADDGCIVWINGVEVASTSRPADPVTYQSVASSTASEPDTLMTVLPNSIVTDLSFLEAGENVIAVQAFNGSLSGSSDFLIEASLNSTIDDEPPFIDFIIPPAGATLTELNDIQVFFSEPITGADASDLLINDVPATDVSFGGPEQLIFQFSQPATGTVSVAFAPDHGITDTSPLANAFAGSSWTYTLDPNAEPPGVLISEFMASNDDTINDEDGDSSDWIEIYNAGSVSANLDGWFLTDDAENLTKWRIPNVVLLPSNFLLVFASGKDRTNVTGQLHANFSLGAGGEYLALVDAQTNVVSEFTPEYPAQFTDISYGRDTISPTIVGYFETPTPGAFNSSSGANVGPPVEFSVPSRTYFSPFNLELSTPLNPAAEIRYVIVNNGPSAAGTNVPTQASTLYTGPIPISGAMQVRARSFVPNNLPGPARTESYLQLNENLRDFTSDIPLVVIHNFGTGQFPGGGGSTIDRSSVVMVFDTKLGRSSLTNLPDTASRAGINLRGSSTQGYPKSSYAVEFWDELNQDIARPVLDMAAESDWVFYAPNQFDISRLHNPIAYELSNQVGEWAPRTRMVETFVNTAGGVVTGPIPTGNYHGIYVLAEKIKRDDERLDIANLELENDAPPEITGGYLMKVDRVDANERTFTAGELTLIYQDPDGLEMVTPQWASQANYIRDYVNNMLAAIINGTYEDWIDMKAFIDHNLINMFTINVDAMRLSGYMHKPRDVVDRHGVVVEPGKFKMGPVWDFDRSAGSTRGEEGFGGGRPWSPIAWIGQGSGADVGTAFFDQNGVFANPWYRRLFRDIDFWQAYIDRYQELSDTVFSKQNMTAMIDGMADEIWEAAARDQQRWGGQGGSNITPRNGTVNLFGYSHTFDGTYEGEIEFQKKWFHDRIDFIDSEFLDRPFFSSEGGDIEPGFELLVSGPSGATIYYTLDGTDPRAPGGGVAPGAQIASGSIILNGNARVVARSRDLSHSNMTGTGPNGVVNPPLSSPWSGPRAATFVVNPPDIRITEVMYHPLPAPLGSEFLDEDFEYIEVRNVGSTSVNLAGYKLGGGIDFTFPSLTLAPGESTVVASYVPAFESRYGTSINVAGAYRRLLANDGDRVVLEGRLGEVIHDFEFDDDWHPATDGFGFALVIRDPNGALDLWNLVEGWRAGNGMGGTPGQTEPADPGIPVIYVNEALTHTDAPDVDFIELYNPNATEVNIGGWRLSDDLRTPKYQIPLGTVIPANGYISFTEADFNASMDPNAFNLRSSGDEVYLYSGDAGGNLTGYIHGFDFGASLNGVSFGRYINSIGEEHFVAQAANSKDAANVGPKVGPVVVSEIHYHPEDIQANGKRFGNFMDEYVELSNITGSSVPLFDPNAPTNTWRLRDSVDYEFPPGINLNAGERILVVGFDPLTNAPAAEAFRSAFGIDPGVRLFGPFDGQLSNGGENVELIQPDLVRFYTTNIVITGVLIDKVDYLDAAPWPVAADGLGAALQRLVLDDYGNDPVNWVAGSPSPGSAYVPGPAPEIVSGPQSQTSVAFMDVSFTVQATGGSPLRYQWLFNGSPVVNATNATLNLIRVHPNQAGDYQVVVMSPANATVSDIAVLTLLIPANITSHPVSRTVPVNTSVTFSVSATSSTPLTFQWRKDGVPIPGATSSAYNIASAQGADRGTYDVVITDAIGPVVSEPAVLDVLVPPVVVYPQGPLDLRVVEGQDLVVGVEIREDATLPLSYRWRLGFSSVTEDRNAFQTFFYVTNLTQNAVPQFNRISVTVTNSTDRVGVTLIHPLIFLADTDGDFMPDEYENAHANLDPNNAADAGLDTDLDSLTNYEEYIADTDPNDDQSYLKIEEIEVGLGVEVVFQAAPNRTYTVLYKDDLSQAQWTKLRDVVGDTEGRTVRVADPDGSTQRFYRLATPQIADEERFELP